MLKKSLLKNGYLENHIARIHQKIKSIVFRRMLSINKSIIIIFVTLNFEVLISSYDKPSTVRKCD